MRAKLRAATVRMEKASREVARWTAAINEEQRQPPQPADTLHWRGWDLSKWRELETKAHDRRKVEISADNEGRLPSEMPRGARNGPLQHERYGLVGAFNYWAEGSKIDASKLVISLIKELELEVRAYLPQYLSI